MVHIQYNKHYVRTVEAAAYCGLSKSSLEKLRLTGGGPAYSKAGARIVVYSVEDLDAWIGSQRRFSTSEAA
ncbi:MAG: helix-turn-helix domain-containing protein [Alphaproteobacteria bacterium]|nr:helix-turn-helix domain-containing protein [Alphaproteobacteria bacterium]